MATTSLLALYSLVAIAVTLSGCGGTYDPDGTTAQTTQAASTTPSTAPSTAPATVPSTAPSTTTTTSSSRAPTPTATTTTTTLAPAGPACPLYNGTHGCYAGEVVDLSVMFVCGANQAGHPAVYPYSTTSCCAQGIRFNPSMQMCCYDGVHDTKDGFCAPWWDEFPTDCYCPYDLKSTPTLSLADHIVVDTRIHPSNPCRFAGEKAGCLNGYEFDYSQQMPCGNFIIDINTHGCCPTKGAFSPYNFKTESCCQSNDAEKRYEVNQGPHACTCRKFGCDEASEVTSVVI